MKSWKSVKTRGQVSYFPIYIVKYSHCISDILAWHWNSASIFADADVYGWGICLIYTK